MESRIENNATSLVGYRAQKELRKYVLKAANQNLQSANYALFKSTFEPFDPIPYKSCTNPFTPALSNV